MKRRTKRKLRKLKRRVQELCQLLHAARMESRERDRVTKVRLKRIEDTFPSGVDHGDATGSWNVGPYDGEVIK